MPRAGAAPVPQLPCSWLSRPWAHPDPPKEPPQLRFAQELIIPTEKNPKSVAGGSSSGLFQLQTTGSGVQERMSGMQPQRVTSDTQVREEPAMRKSLPKGHFSLPYTCAKPAGSPRRARFVQGSLCLSHPLPLPLQTQGRAWRSSLGCRSSLSVQ